MVNPSEYRARPSVQKHLGDSPQTPVKVSSHAADGQQPVAYFSEPRQCSPAKGLLHGKSWHTEFKNRRPFWCEPEVASEAIFKIRFRQANSLAIA